MQAPPWLSFTKHCQLSIYFMMIRNKLEKQKTLLLAATRTVLREELAWVGMQRLLVGFVILLLRGYRGLEEAEGPSQWMREAGRS